MLDRRAPQSASVAPGPEPADEQLTPFAVTSSALSPTRIPHCSIMQQAETITEWDASGGDLGLQTDAAA